MNECQNPTRFGMAVSIHSYSNLLTHNQYMVAALG